METVAGSVSGEHGGRALQPCCILRSSQGRWLRTSCFRSRVSVTAFAEDLMATVDATKLLHAEFVAAVGRAYSLLQLVSETEIQTTTDQRTRGWIHFAKKEHPVELALLAFHISTVGSWRACGLRSRDPGEGFCRGVKAWQVRRGFSDTRRSQPSPVQDIRCLRKVQLVEEAARLTHLCFFGFNARPGENPLAK